MSIPAVTHVFALPYRGCVYIDASNQHSCSDKEQYRTDKQQACTDKDQDCTNRELTLRSVG
jgi:hypothetical protein